MLVSQIFSQVLPARLIARIYGFAVGSQDLALCLHRVSLSRRSSDPYPPSTIELEKLIAVLKMISPYHRKARSQLTLSFDDGYADAIEFVRKEAPFYPHLHWLLFICPAKSERRLGFRWDRYEVLRQRERENIVPRLAPDESLLTHITAHPNLDKELADEALKALPDSDSFKMASIADLLCLQEMANVRLGNHSNSHLKLSSLNLIDAERDIQSSVLDMARIFGSCEDFAFPFGTPRLDYTVEHVELLRDRGIARIWSTYSAPYRKDEVAPGAVLPRFAIIGTWPARRIVLNIALICWIHRVRARRVTEFLALSNPS